MKESKPKENHNAFYRHFFLTLSSILPLLINPVQAQQKLMLKKWETHVQRDEFEQIKTSTVISKNNFIFLNSFKPLGGLQEMCKRVKDIMNFFCVQIPESKSDFRPIQELTRELFEKIRKVNTEVNINLRPMSDLLNFKKKEHWDSEIYKKYKERFLNKALPFGDCEEYSMLKYLLLLEAGFKANELSLAYVLENKSSGGKKLTGHLVTLVKVKINERIVYLSLDNLVENILTVGDAAREHLKFVAITNERVVEWVNVNLVK